MLWSDILTKGKTIAIDIDDVVADGTGSLIARVNERYGVSLTKQDYYDVGGEYWGYYERVWSQHDLHDTVDFDGLGIEMAIDQSHVPLLAGAEFAIKQLAESYKVVFITSRNIEWEHATHRWFKQHFEYDEPKVYFSTAHRDDKGKTKGQLCVELGAHVLIDDNVDHCQSAIDAGLSAVLFGDYGWQANIPETMTRCKDWQSVLEYFNEA